MLIVGERIEAFGNAWDSVNREKEQQMSGKSILEI